MHPMRPLIAGAALFVSALAVSEASAQSPEKEQASQIVPGRRLPFLGHLARDRGIELPLPFGAGLVYYYLDRDIAVSDVRVASAGAPLSSVGDFVQFGAKAKVSNLNAKFDVWLLPFVNVYAIAGYVWNDSETTVALSLPALRPGGEPRRRVMTVPTSLEGAVGGLGMTVAGGYRSFFAAADINGARADLGFDDKFQAVVTSLRAGWHGRAGERPFRVWANATYWDTFATASGTIADPDTGGALSFEVDQGPAHPWTYGLGMQYSARKWLDLAFDAGTDLKGGYYLAIVPVVRF
jgi:hypothetical protein